MKIMIHACPQRMWYVTDYLIPMLEKQGADAISVWNDTEKVGNLKACMFSFASLQGDDGTWHIQDDVLPCRNFVERCRQHDEGLVCGFCCEQFSDNPKMTGTVYLPDAWHSFQCVRIPNAYARECASWVRSGRWKTESPNPELTILNEFGKGDDTFFREFLCCYHARITAVNLRPNLVEHIDWLLGGSTLHMYRSSLPRSDYWDDEELVRELKAAIQNKAPL